MTNDELQKKISEIIDGSVDDWATRDRRGRIQVHVSTIADILVKAGLKFDASISHTATIDMMQQDRINELERRVAEFKQRAEVAEKALKHAVNVYIAHTETSSKKKWWYKYFLREAEKELAEEADGKKEV